MKIYRGCLHGIMFSIPLWALIMFVIWILARCELIETNLLTRLVRLLLNRVRGWWYVDQVNAGDIKKRRAEFIGNIRMKNLMKGR